LDTGSQRNRRDIGISVFPPIPIHWSRGGTLRIDRVTGSSCYLPCLPATPTPRPTPRPKPTVEDISIGNSRAITMVQSRGDVPYHPTSDANGLCEWTVWREATNDGQIYFPLSTPGPTHFPIRVVCLCDPKLSGWYWEVHLDTLEILKITGTEISRTNTTSLHRPHHRRPFDARKLSGHEERTQS